MRKSFGILSVAVVITVAGTAQAVTNPVGGGILHAGLEGTYYGDPDFQREVFTRRDIRLDFDWGEAVRPGGGVPWDKIQSIGTDNYSIRWTGQIMPRFSEEYTVTVEADSVRLWLKPAGTADWPAEPLIDDWPSGDPAKYEPQSGKIKLEAGKPYDIRIDYRERTGPARMRLLWESPSAPQEVVQPTAINGTKPPDKGITIADAIFSASNWGENYAWKDKDNPRKDGKLEIGEDGWPTEDFSFLIRPQDVDLNAGTYLLKFNGSAAVNIGLNQAEFFSADGQTSFTHQTKPGDGYDPATNTTTLLVKIARDRGNCWPGFKDSDRDGPQGTKHDLNSGVTNIRLMRPATLGSDTPHGLDEFFARDFVREMGDTFVCFRWNDVNSFSDYGNVRDGQASGKWADRQPFFYYGYNLLNPKGQRTGYGNENHEYKILLHNRLGRDLYMQVPHFADDDYIRNLAKLIRFGGDQGGKPYDQPTADAFFPPLNPNLRVNLEYSNETPWNTAGQYPQGHWMRTEPDNLRQAWLKDPDSKDGKRFAILNYDGKFDPKADIRGFDAGKRFFALRTVEMSDIFREVFGDENMPAPGKSDPKVRPLLMYQYDNANDTAKDTLFFLDSYFNKTDPKSTCAGEPKPVNYFIYGGGAATYYASQDPIGLDAEHPLTADGLGKFEEPRLPDGTAAVAPGGSPWRFDGTAGIWACAARQEGKLGEIPAPVKDIDDHPLRGFKFTVGPQDVAVYEVGRYVHPGNGGNQTIYLIEADTGEILMGYGVDMRGKQPGDMAWIHTGKSIFVMAGKSYNYPIILQAGKSYYLVAVESKNNPYAEETEITPPPGVSIDCAAAIKTKPKGWGHEFVSARDGTTPNHTFGPVNFRVATKPVASVDGAVNLGFPQDSRNGVENRSKSIDAKYISRQAIFLAGTGSASLEITIPKPGWHALVYSLAFKPDQTPWIEKKGGDNPVNPIMIFVDDGSGERNISPGSQGGLRPSERGWSHGGYWTKPEIGFDFFGSVPFETAQPDQKVKIRFAGTAKARDDRGREMAGSTDPGRVALLDDIQLASSAIMTAGSIPGGGGFAEGAPDVSNWEARIMSMYKYVQAFGLRAISYEGGWYPGGDANKMPLQFVSAFFDPKMVEGERNAVEAMARAGMAMNTDYSRDFALPDHDIANAGKYSRIKAWRLLNAELPKEAANGLPVLSTLTGTSVIWSNLRDGAKLEPGGWMSWNIIAPASGRYAFQVETTSGGKVDVRVDEHQVVVQGQTGGKLENREGVFLTKGMHNLRARASGGAFELVGIACANPGQPYGISGLAGQSAYRSVILKWPAVPGASGYNLYLKERTASDWRKHNPQPLTTAGAPYRVTGLTPDITHNVVLTYLKDGQESAYSNQITAVPLVEADLLAWRFDEELNRAVANSTQNDILLEPAQIEIVGMKPTDNGHFGKQALGTDEVITLDQPDDSRYFQATIAPKDGAKLLPRRFEFGVYSSGPKEKDPRKQLGFRVEVRYSVDGGATWNKAPLTPDGPVKGYANGTTNTGRLFSADLTAKELQGLAKPLMLRIHLYGELGLYHGLGKRGNSDKTGKNWDAVLIGGIEE